MFDTHCHLNFKAFKKILPDVISRAQAAGITHMVIPGTDVSTSRRAVEIAQQHEWIFASVGIHPHHVYQYLTVENNSNYKREELVQNDMLNIEKMLTEENVVAVGEVGMDRHIYENTKYEAYAVNDDFINVQKELLQRHIMLAIKYNKSLILHNREAKADLLYILEQYWDSRLNTRTVFHCCEPDDELLTFAKRNNMFIGVDGDITYYPEKQEFIKNVPLEMLVLETDAPYLLPEPLKSAKKYPNEPSNIPIFVEMIAKLKGVACEELIQQTAENAKRLFNISV